MKLKYIKNKCLLLVLLSGSLFSFSCKKFLDAKPSSNLTLISVNDLQGILDDYATMNNGYPIDGEVSSDNYFLSDADYSGLFNPDDRDFYIWNPAAQRFSVGGITNWINPYKIVYNANLVLETLTTPDAANLSPETINNLKGSALFFRGFTHFSLAQIYAKPYDSSTANQDLGIPIRTSTALEDKSVRGTVQETYDKIISDLQQAITLLPVTSTIKSRPNKVAAYAALARVFLAKQDYVNAGIMANECLKLYNILIDYNSISNVSTTPFTRFNNEVIFHSIMQASSATTPGVARIDKSLYASYNNNDLRKQIFFKSIDNIDYRFSGNYEPTARLFNGLATDEIYLIRAESYARTGNIASAMADLNTLMKNRYVTNTYTDMIATTEDDALNKILLERRKELIFRGLRWSDLRRLNKDNRFKTDMVRKKNGKDEVIATLPANDLRYVLLINQDVINRAGFQQNPR